MSDRVRGETRDQPICRSVVPRFNWQVGLAAQVVSQRRLGSQSLTFHDISKVASVKFVLIREPFHKHRRAPPRYLRSSTRLRRPMRELPPRKKHVVGSLAETAREGRR